ncbi:glycosyltransferase [Rhodoferax sp. U2-2l]|uniref:glycosyltransferase n=1 Tax=Rhodoferax sp. U2-2l TaxID=2884000 RepID=UPI001D0AC6AD|nr:glycosyltransferase [Rhodoferax sp. U2-2l]MCB8747186.1 glycosyltransferase [Rhodoferax sp. U2-2l]
MSTSKAPGARLPREVFPSVVLPLLDAEGFIEGYVERLVALLQADFEFYEVILVNNGCQDRTQERIVSLQARLPNLALFNLASRYSMAIATIAGLDHAIGDYVIVLDPRQDPPSLVRPLIAAALEEKDIVYAVTRERAAAKTFYYQMENRFLKALGRLNRIKLPPALSSARLFSRRALNFILKAVDRHRILSVAPALSGYSIQQITYTPEPVPDAGGGGLNWFYSAYRAVELTLSLSPKPLRLVSIVSVGISFMTVIYSIYVVIYWLTHASVASGWASLSLQISVLFFFLSLVLAVMSEYMQQILENIGRRPLYFYTTQSNSSVMAYAPDLNVAEEGDRALTPSAEPALAAVK